MSDWFTIEEFDTDCHSFASLNANGDLMVFKTWDDAKDMAEFMLEAGPEEGNLPIVGLLCHSHDPSSEDADDDPISYSVGWTDYIDGKVATHEGDYENDAPIWQEKIRVADLKMIAAGGALTAEVENDLEERGLIRQTDKPYAEITPAGRKLIEAT